MIKINKIIKVLGIIDIVLILNFIRIYIFNKNRIIDFVIYDFQCITEPCTPPMNSYITIFGMVYIGIIVLITVIEVVLIIIYFINKRKTNRRIYGKEGRKIWRKIKSTRENG